MEHSELHRTDDEIQGNLQAALGLLGDQKMLDQIASEIQGFPIYPEYVPYEALRKLTFIGGKQAASILVAALGSRTRMAQDAQKSLDTCLRNSVPMNGPAQAQEAGRKYCADFDHLWQVRRYNSWIMNTLSEMVKDPPLGKGVTATPEHIWIWKAWWTRNQRSAKFARVPRSYE